MAFLQPCLAHNRPNRQVRIASALELVPDAATAVERILTIHSQATETEQSDGATWYSAAYDIAHLVGDIGGWSPRQGAGIIAALSPQCSWDENIARALAYAHDGSVGSYSDSTLKCAAIAHGADPADVLRGRKVRSFFRNILGIESAVTIDRHAVAIVYGNTLSNNDRILERPGTYTYIASCYRTAARQLGIAPSTLQATTWLAWRRIKAIDYDNTEVF